MENKMLGKADWEAFQTWLLREEKSAATIEKYLRDAQAFSSFAEDREVTKDLVIEWKESLVEGGYTAQSVNSMLAGVNSLLCFLGREDCKVKNLKIQRQTYCPEEKELTKAEYLRLLDAARDQPQLRIVMETICGTGIRVSELQFFTVEAAKKGRVDISNKGKMRAILIPGKLKKKLLDWRKAWQNMPKRTIRPVKRWKSAGMARRQPAA